MFFLDKISNNEVEYAARHYFNIVYKEEVGKNIIMFNDIEISRPEDDDGTLLERLRYLRERYLKTHLST